MAGSRNYYRYEDDAGTGFTVQTDESNAEATIGGVRLSLARTANLPFLGGRTKRRFVNAFVTASPRIKRKFYIGNPLAIPQALSGAVLSAPIYPDLDAPGTAENWTVTSYRGERTNIPPNFDAPDTGITDGDTN